MREESAIDARERAAAQADGADGARSLIVGDADEAAIRAFFDA
jgi:hypothetical protein